MFNCHAHPGLYETNALVCSASVKDIELISPFPYRSLGSLPEDDVDLDTIEKWAKSEKFLGEVGLDKRFSDKHLQIFLLHNYLGIAEEHKNIITLHQVGWTKDFLDTLSSYNLRGFIVHGFTGSYETYKIISEMGGLISLSPKAENTKFFSVLQERGIIYPFLTETDTLTGEEANRILKQWNEKLSLIFDRDIEKEVEETFFKYIS